ncbi:hypothetical protein CASFOL_039053 [Castilleja foliolosa]|uniref:Uncharacterized protein n=1 Tax=Castilleja foliolosa TaxID=1961234 RepID=A0ABD3BHE3_9LAMI
MRREMYIQLNWIGSTIEENKISNNIQAKITEKLNCEETGSIEEPVI